ncbi:MAG: hypothetical protein JWO60_96, partial [Frankiales bacterium]|nr:hypothetical protein [Frankiales bacterium]
MWSGSIEHVFESVEGPEETDPRAPIDPVTGLPMAPRPVPEAPAEAGSSPGGGADRLPPVHPLVADLQAAITALARAQADGTLAAGSLVDTAALLRAGESVAGLALVEVAAVDRTRAYATVGRASTAGWLGATLTIGDAEARAKVALSRRVTEDLARVGDLLVDGGTTVAHCRALTAGLRGIRP